MGIAVAVLVLDAATKALAVRELAERPPIHLLGGLLTLRFTKNTGAAFGLATGSTILLTLIAIGVIIGILWLARRLGSWAWALTLGLLMGGAAGNLVDRLFRPPAAFQGYVVDWIQLPHWPVFNLADSAIVCGGVLAVILAARGLHIDGSHHQQ